MRNIGVGKYWATSSLSLMLSLGLAGFTPELKAHVVAGDHSATTIVDICKADSTIEPLQCLSEQSTNLNRAKNLARQRGEKDNGGVGVVATEPSMHGPSAESPYQVFLCGDSIEYVFTFRMRPRATADYTYESQVRVAYTDKNSEWIIDTIYNNAIRATPISYSEQLEAEAN